MIEPLNQLQKCQKGLKQRVMWLYYSNCVSKGLWRSRVVSVEWRWWDAEVVSSVFELKGFGVLFVCDFVLFYFIFLINPRFLPFMSVLSKFKLTYTCSWTEIIHNMPTHLCRHVHTCIHFICKFSPTPAVCYCKRFYCTGLCLVSHHRSNNPWTLQCWAVLWSYVPIVSHQPLEYPGGVCSPCVTCTLCQMWCVGTNPHVILLQTYHYCSVVQASHVVQEKIVNTTVLSPGMQMTGLPSSSCQSWWDGRKVTYLCLPQINGKILWRGYVFCL